jgi:hypothetical protein
MDVGKLLNHVKSVSFFSLSILYYLSLLCTITTIGIRAKFAMAGIGTSSTKFNVMKFGGTGNFGLWQRRVKDLLVQQGIVKALYGT